MTSIFKTFLQAVAFGWCFCCFGPQVPASVGSFGEEMDQNIASAFEPYAKRGFLLRDENQGGNSAIGETKIIPCQLFQGNRYVCIVGGGDRTSLISVHIYDAGGNLVETRASQRNVGDHSVAEAHVVASQTGRYLVVIKVEASQSGRSDWWFVYGYK